MLYCKSLSGDKAKSLCVAIYSTLVCCFWCVLEHCHWCILYLYFGLGCYLSAFVPASAHDGPCYFMLYVPVIQQKHLFVMSLTNDLKIRQSIKLENINFNSWATR